MWEWIQGHVAVVLICAALAAIVVLIIRGLIRDKKKGKSTCGANCAHCAMSGSCHGGAHPAESPKPHDNGGTGTGTGTPGAS